MLHPPGSRSRLDRVPRRGAMGGLVGLALVSSLIGCSVPTTAPGTRSAAAPEAATASSAAAVAAPVAGAGAAVAPTATASAAVEPFPDTSAQPREARTKGARHGWLSNPFPVGAL